MRLRCEALFKRVGDDERGAVLVILGVTLVIFLAVAALAVDLSAVATRGQAMQNTADAASLAGVVTYQMEIANGTDLATAEALARATVIDIARQNGIEEGDGVVILTSVVDGRLVVEIVDDDPDRFLDGGLGFGGAVNRSATAEFLACSASCPADIAVPLPFTAVEAEGDGDGYKPITVPESDRIYAINHNAPSRNIVCVHRERQEPCWNDGNTAFRKAYADSENYNEPNPEMPHTGVAGTRIFWSASDNTGHRLFCWDTNGDDPCPDSWHMGDDPRAIFPDWAPPTEVRDKDENRGGGTVAVGPEGSERIFVFTDNHEVHCFNPASDTSCFNYNERPYGGMPTQLDDFLDADPAVGNHGSSIDRIVDEAAGHIYSTIHIRTNICQSPLADPANYGDLVVIRNAGTGSYIAQGALDDEVVPNGAGAGEDVRWDVIDAGGGAVYIESSLTNRSLDSFASSTWPRVMTSTLSQDVDQQWYLDPVSGEESFTIESVSYGGRIDDEVISQEIRQQDDFNAEEEWEFFPWQCGPAGDAGYATGTWLHCWDTGIVSGFPRGCPNFDPVRIHEDATRFSGRLFFYMGMRGVDASEDIDAPILGVCSTGYGATFTQSDIEVQCVNLDGSENSGFEGNMSRLALEIRGSTGSTPGAWGDPHWNDFENRLFYPTEHFDSAIICWDFDDASGWCGTQLDSDDGFFTEDYGFFSEGDCVYALGHLYQFWAFQAGDFTKPCVGTTSSTTIIKCQCNDTYRWGKLDFSELISSGQIDNFDELDIQVKMTEDDSPDPENPPVVFPSDGGWWSIIDDGPIVNLQSANIDPLLTELEVFVRIDVIEGLPPEELEATRFELVFDQLPHLTE